MENKTPLISKVIVIKSHKIVNDVSKKTNQPFTRIDIIDSSDTKYSFFPKKKDGTISKAAEYYKANKSKWDDAMMLGDTVKVEIAFEEKTNTFQGKDGKTYNGVNRTIRMFKDFADPVKQDSEYSGMKDLPTIDPNEIPVVEDKMDIDIDPNDIPVSW
jgi:hypothetical protein